MKTVDRFFLTLARICGFKHRVIDDGNGNPYLLRIYIFRNKHLSVYLHKFFRGDHDRDLHDHPWPWASFVLWGGYWEETPEGTHWRRPGSFAVKKPKSQHRVSLDRVKTKGESVWTLFISGKKMYDANGQPDWGFQTENGWVSWYNYLKPRLSSKDKIKIKNLMG